MLILFLEIVSVLRLCYVYTMKTHVRNSKGDHDHKRLLCEDIQLRVSDAKYVQRCQNGIAFLGHIWINSSILSLFTNLQQSVKIL